MHSSDIERVYQDPETAADDGTIRLLLQELPAIWAGKAVLWDFYSVLGRIQHERDFGAWAGGKRRTQDAVIRDIAKDLPERKFVLSAVN